MLLWKQCARAFSCRTYAPPLLSPVPSPLYPATPTLLYLHSPNTCVLPDRPHSRPPACPGVLRVAALQQPHKHHMQCLHGALSHRPQVTA